MATILPKALKAGDEVRVVAPGNSLAIIGAETRRIAGERLQNELGLRLSFGKHVEVKDRYGSSSVEQRLEDLHAAFADKNVKAVLTVIGGFNGEELLAGLDWSLIKRNPKIFCGFSDTTVLSNAIFAKTGLLNFSGPAYSSFGMKRGFEYTLEQFKKAVMGAHRWQVLPSSHWSDDAWYLNQDKREFIQNPGPKVLKTGKAKGHIVGGNLSSLILLGREYTPKLEGAILFVEECHEGEMDTVVIMRQFGALTRMPGFGKIKGLVLGRFQKQTNWQMEDFRELIARRPELAGRDLPIVCNADFGHTTPFFTFGIGGTAELIAHDNGAQLFFEPFVKE